MNREINFRGKCIRSGSMRYGDLIHGVGSKEGRMYILPRVKDLASIPYCDPLDGVEVSPDTVGQSTGLHDKDCIEIYEGDILFVEVMEDDRYYSYKTDVAYIDGCFLIRNEKLDDYDTLLCAYINPVRPLVEMKIIGNIHDNPELLKGGTQ